VVRAIFVGLKQVFETLFSGQGSSFRRGGCVEFPSPPPPPGDVVDLDDIAVAERRDRNSLPGKEEHISVFLPCARTRHGLLSFDVPKSKISETKLRRRRRRDVDMSARRGQARLDPQSGSQLWPRRECARIGMARLMTAEPAKAD